MKLRQRRSFLAISILVVALANGTFGQEKNDTNLECKVDLNKPGQMADILSNALVRGLKKDPSKVQTYLNVAQENYQTGHELAKASARKFEVREATLFAAVEDYRHCNCTHIGGGAVKQQVEQTPKRVSKISRFAENVLIHVVLHEIGHGLVREFDLPILGNEETLADAFATHYVVTKLPERALEILEARVTSQMIEAKEVPRTEWKVTGEHNSDARRAYQVAALAIAYDANKFSPLAKLVGMNESNVRSAKDYGTEIHRSWRRILQPLWMPSGRQSTEARVRASDDSAFLQSLEETGLLKTVEIALRSFDWHSQVTVYFASGDGGAGWSRSKRTVTVHDQYVHRFNQQAKVFAEQSAKIQP